MKVKFFILCLFSACVYAADSTVIKPPTVIPISSDTVNVLHLAQGAQSAFATPDWYPCPTGSQRVKSNFFEDQANDMTIVSNGSYFYVCKEPVGSNAAYYQSLKSAAGTSTPWINCQPPNSRTATSCTTKELNPPFVRFILEIPQADRQRNQGTVLTFRDAELFFGYGTLSSMGKTVKSTQSAVNYNGNVISTWRYSTKVPPDFPPANYQVPMTWLISGMVATDNPATTTARAYTCGRFQFYMTRELFGKTVTFSCQGFWRYDDPTAVYSSTNPLVTISE